MIRLNMTNQPGLQVVDEAEIFDLEGLILKKSAEETASGEPESEGTKQAPDESIKVPDIEDIPDMPLEPSLPKESDDQGIDEDLFKLAEANLDLIEQAEEEETGSKAKVKKAPEAPVKDKKRPKKFPLLRYGIIVGGFLVLLFLFWLYSNGKLTRSKVNEVTRDVAETVTEKATQTAERIPDATRQLTSEVKDVTEKVSSEVSTSRERVATRLSRSAAGTYQYGQSDLSDNVIQVVQRGQAKLSLVTDVLAQFPADARILYLRLKDDKLSFILYVRSHQVAEQIRGYFTGQSRFLSPEVFFTENTGKYPENPVEIMAIVRFRVKGSDDRRGYKYLTDRQLSQYIWQAAVESGARMNPLKISSRDVSSVRSAEIVGNGKIVDIIALLQELAIQRHNLEVALVSLKSDAAVSVSNGILDYHLSSVIYPGNM